MTRRQRTALFVAVLAVACTVAGAAYVYHVLARPGDGPTHTYTLAGRDPLTDEQAVSLAKQTLQRDNLFSETMVLERFADGSAVNRGDDTSYVSVSWSHPANGRWYVQLHRTPDRVDAKSYPGK
jgi:hypothetical protein